MERHRRRDILEMDRKRQRATDREEETERRGTGEETERRNIGGDIKEKEGQRQKGTHREEETETREKGEETEGKRQRRRDRREIHRGGKKRGEGVGTAVVFTSLKGQWCTIFGLSFLHRSLPLGGPKEDSFEQI